MLMGDRLSQVLDSVQLGRATLNKIRQNLTWALAYNVVGIPLAAGGCRLVLQSPLKAAQWPSKLCVTSGLRLPAYALALTPQFPHFCTAQARSCPVPAFA